MFNHNTIKAKSAASHYNQPRGRLLCWMATIFSEYVIVCCSCCDMFVLALTYLLCAMQIHPSSTCDLVVFCFCLLNNNHHDDQLRPTTNYQRSKYLQSKDTGSTVHLDSAVFSSTIQCRFNHLQLVTWLHFVLLCSQQSS